VNSAGENKPGDDSNNGDNESGDVIYTHVNDEFESETFQIDERAEVAKEEEARGESSAEADVKCLDDADKDRLAKEQEQKARTERLARIERERLYKMPVAPHIIVHPSKTAKGGKDTIVMLKLRCAKSKTYMKKTDFSFWRKCFVQFFCSFRKIIYRLHLVHR